MSLSLQKGRERGDIFVWSPSTIIKLLLLLFFVNMCFFLQLMKSSIGKTTDHIFIALRVQVFILKYIFFHRFKMSSFLFHWLKQKKMVFGKMDHLKRPIEIEILRLKNEISLLILACVADRFVMCWAFSLWDGEIKFDLHPNLWLCYHKQQHIPTYPTSWL